MSHCWDYLSPEGVFLSYFPDCLSPGLFVSRKRLSVPFLGLFVSRRRFFVPLLGLFVSRRRFFCPIAEIICLLKGDFCPIARIICLSKVVCLSHFLGFLSPERGFLSHCWDYFSPEGSFFVPLLGLFVFPTAGVVVSKRRYFAHCWDCLSPEGGFLSQCRDFLFPKEGILPTAFYLPEEICFSKRTII